MDKAGGIAYCFDVIEAADDFCGLKSFVRVCNYGYENGVVSNKTALFEKILSKYSAISDVDSTSRIIDRAFCWGEISLLFGLKFSRLNYIVDGVIRENYGYYEPEDDDEDEDIDLWEDNDDDDDPEDLGL